MTLGSQSALDPVQPRGDRRAGVVLSIGALAVGAGAIGAQFVTGKAVVYWPFAILVVTVGLVIALITVVRMHAFLALILSAMAAGIMAVPATLAAPMTTPLTKSSLHKPDWGHFERAVEGSAIGLGETAGGIAIVIGMASIIGMCMLASGAADRVVRWFLGIFGEKRAGLALLVSTYVISIPIFFDTLFMLLVPIARALRLRTGRDYMLYVMAICTAGIITHSMVIPHPGPLAMADRLQVNVGLSIIMGLASGVVPLALGWFLCKWINKRLDHEVVVPVDAEESAAALKPDSALPPLWLSLAPVILPVILMSAASVVKMYRNDVPRLEAAIGFVGNRNTSLVIGAMISLWLLVRQGRTLKEIGERIGPPLETAGTIILITAAGGAFGYMLRSSGVGDAIKTAVGGLPISYILLSYVVAMIIRIAQGSATVAMLTTAGMLAPLIGPDLAYHRIYIFLAIGYGAFFCSWMNDSGFWVVARLGGLTEKQMLRSWTLMSSCVSFFGLITTLVMSTVLPLKGLGK